MPDLNIQIPAIQIPVVDVAMDDTVFKQTATYQGIAITGGMENTRVVMTTLAECFTLKDGGIGNPVQPGFGPQPLIVELVADNNCAVYFNPQWVATATEPTDPRNGEVLYYASPVQPGMWYKKDANGNSLPEQYRLEDDTTPMLRQGAAFAVAMTQPLQLTSLVLYHMTQANSAAFNRYRRFINAA